jgi:hypothetical protein
LCIALKKPEFGTGEKMNPPQESFAVSSSAASTTVARFRIAGLILLATLAFDASPADALPPANGSNCNSTWVNNEGALDCFIKGEEETRNGTPNPHYVGCTPDGQVFCCSDTKRGQVCEAVSGIGAAAVRRPTDGAKLGAILDAQQTILMSLSRLNNRVDDLESKLNSKSAP